jgi:hypothetical protein
MRKSLFLWGIVAISAVAIVCFLPPDSVSDVVSFGPLSLLPFVIGNQQDKFRGLPNIVVANGVPTDGVRAKTQGENNKRTERYQLRVSGQVDITVAGTGILNRGSILAALPMIGFTDGGTDKIQLDARLARQIGEVLSPSPLPATRLAGAGVQAATQLTEIVPLYLSAYRTSNPNETKYSEPNKQLAQEVFIVPSKLITRLAEGGALAGTITGLTANVEQVFDDMVASAPFLQTFVRQIQQDVLAANTQLKIDLRGSRFVRGIMIQQDSNFGEVSDIINGLVLRGDSESLFGDRPINFADLVAAQAYEFGGALPAGYLWIDFCRYGRLSTMWNPYQQTNFRLELDVSVSARAGGLVRVAMVEYERTPSTTTAIPFTI